MASKSIAARDGAFLRDFGRVYSAGRKVYRQTVQGAPSGEEIGGPIEGAGVEYVSIRRPRQFFARPDAPGEARQILGACAVQWENGQVIQRTRATQRFVRAQVKEARASGKEAAVIRALRRPLADARKRAHEEVRARGDVLAHMSTGESVAKAQAFLMLCMGSVSLELQRALREAGKAAAIGQ